MNFSGCASPTKANTAFKAVSSSSFRGDIRKASLSASGAIGSCCRSWRPGSSPPLQRLPSRLSISSRTDSPASGPLAKHGKEFGQRKRRRISRHIPNRALECKTVLPNGTQRPYVVSVNSLEASESAWKNQVAFHLWANLGYFHLQTWEHLNLGDSTERWPPKSIKICGSGGCVLLLLCKWLELPQKLPSVPGKAWSRSLENSLTTHYPLVIQHGSGQIPTFKYLK